MRTICPVCNGKGTVNDPTYFGQFMAYCGPNGESCPQVQCQNCSGQRWVGEPDVDLSKPQRYEHRMGDYNI